MKFKIGDTVRLKNNLTMEFRVGHSPVRDSIWVICKLAGHTFYGYLPADELILVKRNE